MSLMKTEKNWAHFISCKVSNKNKIKHTHKKNPNKTPKATTNKQKNLAPKKSKGWAGKDESVNSIFIYREVLSGLAFFVWNVIIPHHCAKPKEVQHWKVQCAVMLASSRTNSELTVAHALTVHNEDRTKGDGQDEKDPWGTQFVSDGAGTDRFFC